ncbi:hypothetical protein Nepgr_027116 [Nepenthes gracilis]|uniref:Uncharacterized protein n=1 Tax=Nepenthes gracilis TaxID=150966 RepID=A0AAD3Y167_NEPGR|nr:hypothetical protein Nepgr_027116 [Nepenthes gracilis]
MGSLRCGAAVGEWLLADSELQREVESAVGGLQLECFFPFRSADFDWDVLGLVINRLGVLLWGLMCPISKLLFFFRSYCLGATWCTAMGRLQRHDADALFFVELWSCWCV